MQISLYSLLLQVVEVSSWLTSNARLLMEVGTQQAAGKDAGIGAHRSGAAAAKPTGFHSDQVQMRLCSTVDAGCSCHAQSHGLHRNVGSRYIMHVWMASLKHHCR